MLAGALAVGLLVQCSPLNGPVSRALLDAQLRYLAPRVAPSDVLVVDIDDASLAALKPHFGSWPFKRDVYALAIEQLREIGASVIAIDLLLADSQSGDEALARTLARPGAPVVLAAAGMAHATDDAPLPHVAAWQNAATAMPTVPAYVWPRIALPASSVWPSVTANSTALRLGVITSPVDDDGVLRHLPLWHEADARRLPLLSWAVDRATPTPALVGPPPLDEQGRLHLAFPRPSAAPPVRPFSELALAALGQQDSAALQAAVRGRAVFIGSSALLADSVMTVNGQVSGTLVLAQAYSALRQGSWVRPAAAWASAALLLLSLLPAVATVWRGRARPRLDLAAALLALLLVAGLTWVCLGSQRMALPLAAPLAAAAAGLFAALWLHMWQQQAQQRALAQELAVAAETELAKSAFLANVSHEIRTPLNALLGVAELLAASALTAQQQRHVNVFREAGQALHSLINDLLDLSKIEAGRFELDPSPFALRPVLDHLMALMEPRAQQKGLRLQLDVAADLPTAVLGDRKRLEQGLMNLLGNGIKFTAQGEVRLRAWPDATQAGMLCFEVTDTGIGIAASKLATIFEPFAQADNSVTRQHGGTGLGLAITRSVAGLMGGTVQVRSTPGLGSEFTLRLPLPSVELPNAPVAPGSVARPDTQRALHVLLAEDNEVNVYIFRAMIEGQAVTLDLAVNGIVALELLRANRYDLAFIDIQMPGLDGLSVTRELRQIEAQSGRLRTPVVALTANAFASDVQASLEAGCDHHLAKPVSRQQLLAALAQQARIDPLASDPGAADQAPPASAVIDHQAALAAMGGDAALYARRVAHAAVFFEGWQTSFDQACTELDFERARHLAHDLSGIAATLGAQALSAAAAQLELALRTDFADCAPDSAAPGPLLVQALAPVQKALAPVMVALSPARCETLGSNAPTGST